MVETAREGGAAAPPRASAAADATWRPADRRCVLLLLAAVALLWAPRLGGAMDLRYDAGVYHILGTSLHEGRGYRLLNEPGAPEAVQYPPLLPALVAAHQALAGSAAPEAVGPWLRVTYCVLHALYAVACFALARRLLPTGLALAAALIPTLHGLSLFLSDLLFAELPYALLGVLLALVVERTRGDERPRHLALAGALGAAAALLRTAGVALLAAWVGEALLRRRWRQGLARAAVALIPVVAWQAHVARVQASDDWRAPAYEYQRAPYQFNNVTYRENVALLDPFRPELGRLSAADLTARLVRHAARMPLALGETISATEPDWRRLALRPQALHRRLRHLADLVAFPLAALGLLAIGGLVRIARRGHPLGPLYALVATLLVCSTPWPIQFVRYLTPLQPFLAIGLVAGAAGLQGALAARGRPRAGRAALIGALAAALLMLVYSVQAAYRYRQDEGPTYVAGQGRAGPRLFYYDADWAAWDEVIHWIGARAPADAVVASIAPHLAWLRIGRPSVFPPLEVDPARAQRLLEAVPVSYVVIDNLTFLDLTRRYATPAVQAYPDRWRLVHRVGWTTVYERVADEVDHEPR
ncbi:MAG: hypothetical protein M9894_28380 [Planctomycetes bacterium]|nr:hypothetical protein [Planctomycetota bacterium]